MVWVTSLASQPQSMFRSSVCFTTSSSSSSPSKSSMHIETKTVRQIDGLLRIDCGTGHKSCISTSVNFLELCLFHYLIPHHLWFRCTSKQMLCVKWDESLLTVIKCGTGHKCCISTCLQSTYFWMRALNLRSVTSAWVNFSPFWTRTLPPGSSTQCEDTQLRSWEERIFRSPKSQLNVMCTASGWCSWNWSRVDIRLRTRKVDRTCSPSMLSPRWRKDEDPIASTPNSRCSRRARSSKYSSWLLSALLR